MEGHAPLNDGKTLRLGAAFLALIGMSVGVAVLSACSDGEPAGGSRDYAQRHPELQDFVQLVEEATTEARAVMSDAVPYMVVSGAGGVFTFRFMQPGTPNEMAAVGPYIADPSFPLWEIFPDQVRDPALPEPEALDLSRLRNTPEAVAAVMRAELNYEVNVRLWMESGELTWFSFPAGRILNGPQCHAPDADLSAITCAPPTPSQ